MPLHLIKLCVGVDSFDDLDAWVGRRRDACRRTGDPPEHIHVTRMAPRRAAELVDGGSLYWVIRGIVQARERLIGIRPFDDGDGVRRCRIVMEPHLVRTEWQPRRPFQGWRYLKAEDAPADLDADHTGREAGLPPELSAQLAALGLR